jgi:DNA-binding HxlR family transcriptional regulator
MICPYCNKEIDNCRDRIIYELNERKSVTELFNKLKVKSFGTIAYHLKKLEEEGIILKEKTKVRGNKTYYWLKSELKDKEVSKEEDNNVRIT